MFCSNCGSKIELGESFCRECGSRSAPAARTGQRTSEPTLYLPATHPTHPVNASAPAATPAPPVSPVSVAAAPVAPAAPAANKSNSQAKMILGGLVGIALILLISIPLFLWLVYWRTPASTGVILRLHGSNTMGAKMIPAMAEAFLKEQGATEVKKIPGKDPEEMTVQGLLPGETTPQSIEIKAHGSDTAFQDLASDACDIGMASRKIKQEEVDKLSALGDMTAKGSENPIALDGIAVIVNHENPVTRLTKDQIKKIFTGEITNWSDVGGTSGKISVYARDDKSGTFDTFKALVIGKTPLVSDATRFEDSGKLSDGVAGDDNGIGFIGYPYIKNAKALAVADGAATPLIPSRFTIATEDYLLTRRLYLYVPPQTKNAYARKFVEFALGAKGREVVESEKFVSSSTRAEKPVTVADAPDDYQRLTSGAERIPINFRFRAGKTQLDNKAQYDIDLVVETLDKNKKVMLLGFADGKGSLDVNQRLSEERAKAVEQEFKQRGVTPANVTGFGSKLPVASNDSEEGREKNRRVEIWLKP